jgi:hypothetical protein
MAIRDCSNVPNHLVPEWVRASRERKRETQRQHAFAKRDWPRICAEIDALKKSTDKK